MGIWPESGIGRNSGQACSSLPVPLMLFGIAVQVAAFLRTAVIAAVLGTSLDVDAYNLGVDSAKLHINCDRFLVTDELHRTIHHACHHRGG